MNGTLLWCIVLYLGNTETKWDDIEHLLTYGIEDCMRLQAKETPLFLSDNSLLSGACVSSKALMYEKEKVGALLFILPACVNFNVTVFFCIRFRH